MKPLVLALLVAGALAAPARVFALPTQIAYNASIPDGLDLGDANDEGVLFFDLDSETASSCVYYMEWYNGNDNPVSVDCFLQETKPHSAASCIANASVLVPSVLTKDPQFDCRGWDTNGQMQSVFLFVAGEDPTTGDLAGVIQFSAANTWFYAFRAEPYP